jgi:hypothetical protein
MSGLNKRWQFMTLPLPFLSLNLMPIRVVLLRNATWDFCIKWDWSIPISLGKIEVPASLRPDA